MAAAAAAARGPGQKLHTLVTIRFSHYNEKARWALDHHRVPYMERPYLPLMSTFGVLKAGGWSSGKADRSSTRLSTPLLITDEGKKLHDSALIASYADERYGTPATSLLPSKHKQEILATDLHYHDFLGPHTRRLAYFHLLKNEEVLMDCFSRNVDPAQFRVFRMLWPVAKNQLQRLGLTKDKVEKSHGYILREFDAVAEKLEGHKGDFLLGESFSLADLSFACMASPVLLVQPHEGFAAYLPSVETVVPGLQDIVRELRSHPAGQFAMRMFRLHRGDRQLPCQPPLRVPIHDQLAGAEGVGSEGQGGRRPGGLGPGVVMKAQGEGAGKA